MRPCWLLLIAALWLPAVGAAQVAENSDSESIVATASRQGDQPEPRELTKVVEQIVTQSRAFRQQQDRGDLEVDPQLMETAQYFAQYMAETNQYGHQADGQRPSQRAKAHGYEYCMISENIGYLFSSEPLADEVLAQRFVDGWKESPEHRENMLEPAVTQIGAAVAQSEENGYYFAVQMFGRPESAAIRFELTNETQEVLRYRIGEQVLELPPQYTRVHKRCRTGEITLIVADQAQPDNAADQAEPGSTEPDQAEQQQLAFEPQPGDRLVVVKNATGQLQIQRRAAEEPQVVPESQSGQSRSDTQGESR